MRRLLTPVLGLLALGLTSASAEPPKFEWKDGDRVVLIGDTMVEREQSYGYLETLITAQNPTKGIEFRNLGWSADTPLGLSRAAFDPPAAGFVRLREHVLALKPTVLIVGYGMAESFQGEAGIPSFLSGLNTTLDALAPAKARLILLSPIAHEDRGRPLPDPAKHNASLARYRDAIKTVADARNAWFVDVYEPTVSAHDYGIDPLTDNGIHPSAYGSWYFATVIDSDLRKVKREPSWNVRVDVRNGRVQSSGTTVSGLSATADHTRFETLDAALPTSPPPEGAPKDVVWAGGRRSVRVAGLKAGTYTLKVDGKTVATGDEGLWAKGAPAVVGPEYDQAEALRLAVNAKNRLYFYRWRPQNETYLFGFRKHEQGNNAREIPLFDSLVAGKEAEIARLRTPARHVYEFIREGEVGR